MRGTTRWLALTVLLSPLALASAEVPAVAPSSMAKDVATPAAPNNLPSMNDDDAWSWLVSDDPRPITCGNAAIDPELWQHTWGVVGVSVIPDGSKMAPNGIPYNPLFSLDLLLNIALTADRAFYAFGRSKFWAQKPGEGITNADQGQFDFSKRQFDLEVGIAWNFYTSFEARVLAYSYNNLNRGTSLARPIGYNDGTALEMRYYLPSTDFDRGLYRYVAVGYRPTKELIGQDGELFKPSYYAAASLALDFIPERFYAYTVAEFSMRREPAAAKLLYIEPGVACRPFEAVPALEFRLGLASTIDLEADVSRTLLYAEARVVW